MIDVQVARDKIAQFESPDELAAYFLEEGICGMIQKSDRCPIAVWMKQQTGEEIHVSASGMWRQVSAESGLQDFIEHTPVLTSFVLKFDALNYPELALKPMIRTYDDDYYGQENKW